MRYHTTTTNFNETVKALRPYSFDWSGFGRKEMFVREQAQKALDYYTAQGHLVPGWTVTIDHRPKRRAGVCRPSKKTIGISAWLFKLNGWVEVENTIKHEIAHAIAVQHGDRGHGCKWKAIARAIGDTGERCYSSEDVATPKGKYTRICDNCGRERQLHRRPKRTNSACSDCCRKYASGRYDARFILRVVKNQ